MLLTYYKKDWSQHWALWNSFCDFEFRRFFRIKFINLILLIHHYPLITIPGLHGQIEIKLKGIPLYIDKRSIYPRPCTIIRRSASWCWCVVYTLCVSHNNCPDTLVARCSSPPGTSLASPSSTLKTHKNHLRDEASAKFHSEASRAARGIPRTPTSKLKFLWKQSTVVFPSSQKLNLTHNITHYQK